MKIFKVLAAISAAAVFKFMRGRLKKAEAESRAKSVFLANISHEIRTPLNAVVGLSELALVGGTKDAETEDRLEKIHASGMIILNIVNDILDISKIGSGKFVLRPVKYGAPGLIGDIIALNAVRIGEKPINFKISIDENLPEALYGDDLRVKQIFNNLLSNAFKYTNAGTVEWRLGFKKDNGGVWLESSVTDTGIGIKPESLRKLFLSYNRADANYNRKVEGTGLGLSITRQLTQMMDGTVSVTSEYGKGSEFTVRLRQGYVTDTPIGKATAESLTEMRYTARKRSVSPARMDLSYARVLVVDDIATNLDVVKGMLKPYGIKTDCAASGAEAIKIIRGGEPRYDAVFMDHMMPGTDGIEAVRVIRGEIQTDYARTVPIIALTANAIAGNDEMFAEKGFQGFIRKPIDADNLDTALKRWVRDRKLDINAALKRFGGDSGALTEVLSSYAAEMPELIKKMDGYLEEGRLKDYAVAVHGIKGSSYGISAGEAGRMASELEREAVAANLNAVKAGHKTLKAELENLLPLIEAAVKKLTM